MLREIEPGDIDSVFIIVRGEKLFNSGRRKSDFLKIGYNIPCLAPMSEDY